MNENTSLRIISLSSICRQLHRSCWDRPVGENGGEIFGLICYCMEHWLCSLSLVVTEQDIKTHQRLKKKPNKTGNKNNTNNKYKNSKWLIAVLKFMVSVKSSSLAKLERLLLHPNTMCFPLGSKLVDDNGEVSTSPKWHVLYVWALNKWRSYAGMCNV